MSGDTRVYARVHTPVGDEVSSEALNAVLKTPTPRESKKVALSAPSVKRHNMKMHIMLFKFPRLFIAEFISL